MFTTINLAGGRVLVQGKDQFGNEGKTVLDGVEWNQLKVERKHDELHEEFDAKIAEFFKPLTEAAAQLEAAHSKPNVDPLFYIVEQEATPGQEAQHEQLRMLDRDSVILRLLEQDAATDRLIWISDTELEILEASDANVADTDQVSSATE